MAVQSVSLPLSSRAAQRLANGLGVFSECLGLTQIVAPGKVNSLIGVCDTSRNRALQRIFGAQEIMSGTGVFAGPRRDVWIWSRVAGDLIHISLMASALNSNEVARRTRAVTTLATL